MNNKMVLNIMIVYFVILSIVLVYQLTRHDNIMSAPSNSGAVLAEDRLNNAVVFYNDSPVLLSNKKQMLLDSTNPSYTPLVKGNTAYLPVSFFSSVYGANVSYDNSETSATIRLDNSALVVDSNEARLVNNSDDKELETETKPIVYKNVVYVPADVFAEAYNKKVYVYGSIGVISSEEFTQADNGFLNGLVSQVNDLPYVVNEANLKSVAKISSTDDIFKDIENRIMLFEQKQQPSMPVRVVAAENNSVIAGNDSHIFYGGAGKIDILSYDSETTRKIGEIPVEKQFTSRKLILQGFKLIAIGDNKTSSGNAFSEIYIYNIADIANIKTERKYTVSGYYKNAVLTGGYLYTMSQNSVYGLYNGTNFMPPSYTDSIAGHTDMSFENIQYFPENGSDDFTVISAINIEDSTQKPNVKAFVGAGGNIYLSGSNFYVSKSRTTAFEDYESVENSNIYRFSLTNGNIQSSGHIILKGHLINSTAISESNGYCRMVTKFTDNDKKVCNVYVLNNNMEICGQANKVASDDDISYAVFTDNEILLTPAEAGGNIYAVNLDNPTMPQGKGALKLSKGRELIYNYDETTIITIDNGGGTLKLNMYDISDFNNPKQLYSQELGRNENITSMLFDSDTGFLFDKEKNIMVVPVKIIGNGATVFEGAYVYNVYKDEGFNRIGTIMAQNARGTAKFKGNIYMFSNEKAVIADIGDIKKQNTIEFNGEPIQ